jgi:hypothetical protein
MSKTYLLLLGALIAALALQGCTKDDPASSPDPMVDQTPADQLTPTQNWMGPDGSIELAKVEIALGGGSGDQPVLNTVQSGLFANSFGLGALDVTLSGEGRVGTASACPNSVDPATGLPWAVDPCAGNRGTFGGGVLQSTLTVSNITGAAGSLGNCALYPLSICTIDADCLPNSTGGGNYCSGTLVTDSSATAGFCQDGVAACASANSSANGLSTACTDGVCSDNGAPCTSLAGGLTNCADPGTATCNDTAVIGTGQCWTGCGLCQNGRDLNCVGIQYTGSQPVGTSGDLDALGNIKCSGGPYGANVASTDDGIDTWLAGNPGINQGGSANATISIDAFNDSYCIHSVTVVEQPHGNVDNAACRTLCGDGVIADLNLQPGMQERCEPRPDGVWVSGNSYDLGCDVMADAWNNCTDTAPCGCSACGTCEDVSGLCGNGAIDAGEDCDFGVPQLDNCCNPVTCMWSGVGSTDPQAVCAGAPACQSDVCGALGVCTTANDADGSGCAGNGVGECSGADTCTAGVCQDNDLAGYCLGQGSSSAICNPDVCAGGVCTDVANAPDTTDCSAEVPAGQCLAGACAGVLPNVVSMTPRANTGPSVYEMNGAGSGNFVDPDDGMPASPYTGAHLAGVDAFIAVPNAAGAMHQDTVIYDVVTDGGAAPTCTASTGACTVYVEAGAPANTYFVTCLGPDLGVPLHSPAAGPGTSVPNFATAQAGMTITCTADGGAGNVLGPQATQVGIADIALMNEVWPAAGGATTLSGYGYCSDNEPLGCDTGGLGGTGFGVVTYGILFNTAQLSPVAGNWSMASPSYAAAPSVDEYAMDGACKTPAAGLDTTDIAAGFVFIQGDVNSSTCPWRVVEAMRANVVVLAQPAGTVAEVRVSGWSTWFNLNVFSNTSGTVSASDALGLFVNPVTNKHAFNIYQ